MKVERLDRLCIGVPDLEEAKETFGRLLGLEFEFSGDVVMPDHTTIRMAISDQGIELLEVPGKEIHLRSFHFKVDDLPKAKEWMMENQVPVVNEFSVGKMDEVVLNLFGLRTILIDYPGTSPGEAAKG